MEYNAKIDNKPNNLIEIHREHEKYFQHKMEFIERRHNLTKEDTRLWIKRNKKTDDFMLTISGSSLQQCSSGLFFWRKVRVMSKHQNPSLILKSILYDFRLKHFMDEDAQGGGFFTGKTKDGVYKFAYCYVSSDFKEGYFENHSLEVKPEIPW